MLSTTNGRGKMIRPSVVSAVSCCLECINKCSSIAANANRCKMTICLYLLKHRCAFSAQRGGLVELQLSLSLFSVLHSLCCLWTRHVNYLITTTFFCHRFNCGAKVYAGTFQAPQSAFRRPLIPHTQAPWRCQPHWE